MNPIKVPATIVEIESYGAGTYLLRMQPARQVPRFKAGQFLHLAIDSYDPAGGFWPESRVFSIASSFGEPFVEIVYSVKGVYTKRMQNELQPGSNVWLKLPYGNFVIGGGSNVQSRAVLIAGGTGVSPFLPYLSALEHGGGNGVVVDLHYGVRENSMTIKRRLLQRLALTGQLNLFYNVQESDPEPFERAVNSRGSLDIDEIFKRSRYREAVDFYISGPPGMIRAFSARLKSFGVAEECVKIDEWE